MRTYIDSAEVENVREAYDLGLVDGVTTNPSLVAGTDREYRDIIDELTEFVDGPISVEVIATDYEEMLEEAREYDTWGDNIAVKLPMTRDGMKALRTLSDEGVQTNITLIFSVNQALIAAKNGATMVSPFIGRLDDNGHDGVELIEDIRTVYDNYDFETDILAASIRHPFHVQEVAKAGADIATLPPDVADSMFDHPRTDSGLEAFLDDWGDRESPALK
ncbi:MULTISPECIES: fructose-6-phosphate aldolase [unclassified Halorhabdus]|uniref:fructose-6-phosphate aldolase n=1 Tax=unclassified Halorhabdus TaxID=2621901 RepID=UPI0023DC5909|nr:MULTISPECIES: fructose-6-phosphate aldolase [unclassified Halorhabdus]WEL16949.1 Transaldolase [Halorhabdus sp. SVX81]WEL20823.1 Transaldolase [Halorhabdus sp. BNX81]